MRNSVARLGTRYPLFFGSDPLDALTPGPGVLAPAQIRADGFDVLLGRMAELPRCVACRVTVQVGQSVVFRADGRIQHAECLPVICPVCDREVRPQTPIRRDGEQILHANCWIRRFRSIARAD